VIVTPGGAGASCRDDEDCDAAAGLTCLCGSGTSCPRGLAAGVCTRQCASSVCGGGELCADLSRGFSAPMSLADGGVSDGGVSEVWRVPICLPMCSTSDDCRPGFVCRELPALVPEAPAGGTYSWRRACFADLLSDDGGSCVAPAGGLDPSRCLSGRCDPFGARGLCTSDCAAPGCPSNAACAAFNATPSSHLCLRRCDAANPCNDPLLACRTADLPPGQSGAFGFTVPASEPAGTTYCAPRRCSAPSDCAQWGRCIGSFCVHNS
jgi:hypothetical protein